MPNHVTTRCVVEGPVKDLRRFRKDLFQEEPGNFDFNRIIPPPAEVVGTESSSDAEMGLYALRGVSSCWGSKPCASVSWDEYKTSVNPDRYEGITSREEFLEHLKKTRPQAVEAGQKAAKCFDATGYTDWYGWNISNWGTKWGSYSVGIDVDDVKNGKFEFHFDTAWSFPSPIFDKLVGLYPTLSFTTSSFDEGWVFASVGVFSSAVTLYDEFRPTEQKERARELHMKVYGTFPEEDEE